jgi:hypothetical protein
MKRVLKWPASSLCLLILITAGPILFVESSCRGKPIAQAQAIHITDPLHQRPEARTLLTYPEWHIVYAYEGYAESLTKGPPHSFAYIEAVTGFWSSLCALTKAADEIGEAGFDSKVTIYTIGASFTLEMAAKSLYEETIGRAISWIGSSQQDQLEKEMANKYAKFLQQTPWYKFDFSQWVDELWSTPASSLRSWERRIALTIEWKAKSIYAQLIAKAASDIGPDQTTMLIAHTAPDFGNPPLSQTDEVFITNTDRYRVFTKASEKFAYAGGNFNEIAGNDDILISVVGNAEFELPNSAAAIYSAQRIGFSDQRLLILVKVRELANMIRYLKTQNHSVEHIYDY